MLIPYGTDAPIYHFPFATLGIIAANVAVFAAEVAAGPETIRPYTLQFGVGFHPIQWLTYFFLHADPGHLIGNMIFLWGFGIVVEGKVGPLVFAALYSAIGLLEGVVVQGIMWNSEAIPGPDGDIIPCALGASGAIFGLLAICLIWAPKNDLNIFLWLLFRPIFFEMSIRLFVALYLGLNLWNLYLQGFEMSSELLHVIGAALGLGVGIGMLKMDWVDCEGWDLFSVMAGRNRFGGTSKSRAPQLREMSASEKRAARRRAEEPEPSGEELLARARKKFAARLEAGDPLGAIEVHEQAGKLLEGWELSTAQLGGLIKSLHAAEEFLRSIPLMAEYAKRSPERSDPIRLKMAQILLKAERPVQAERVLATIRGPLSPEQESLRRRLQALAEHQQEEGVMELEGEA